jgi:superfamily II DNA or RNA helicase
MAIVLRPYQKDMLACIRQDWRDGLRRLIVSSATGTGKTWAFVFIIWAARQNGLRCVVLVNTDELVQQTVEKLKRVGVDPGIIKARRNEWMRDVVVASIQTLSKASRLYNLPPNHFGVVITDECHYANAPSYQRVLWYFADAWHLGVTATPFRGDKRSVAGAGWNKVSYVYTMQDAIRDGWLAPVRFVQVSTGVEIGKLTKSKATLTSGPDFNAKMLEKVVNTPERNDKIVEAALEHLVERTTPLSARMRRVVGFCAGVDHAVDLANAFRHRGVEAFAVYGSMEEKHRRLLLKAHRMGRFPVLTNCNILTHGYDDPAIEAIIMARPTESKVLYIQEIGRGLRRSEETGKRDCVVLDVVDVMKKHTMTIGKELLELGEAIEEQGKAPAPNQSSAEGETTAAASGAEGTDFEAQASGLIPVDRLKGDRTEDPDGF